MSNIKSTPLENSKSTPLALSTQLGCRNKYLSSQQITEIAIEFYKMKGGRGITYADLLERGLAYHKRQAQDTLKYHFRIGTLFTLGDKRPQQYYPSAIKSEIIESLQKSTPIDPTGVECPGPANLNPLHASISPLANCLETVISQTLEGYVLPLLPEAPLFIHNMHFKTKIVPECYAELDLPHYNRNHGKCHTEIIGNTHIDYTFYSSGIVNVNTSCSRNPYKLETEEDRSRLIAFFGQIRDRLVLLLRDKHERLVPDIMNWQLTECDINKDIKVSDLFHFSAIKIQVKHLDHLFSIYIKSMGKNTVCRIEERKHPVTNKPAIAFIDDIFNPANRIEIKFAEQDIKLQEINDKLTRLETQGKYSHQISDGVADM
jgi:hypothetical protein